MMKIELTLHAENANDFKKAIRILEMLEGTEGENTIPTEVPVPPASTEAPVPPTPPAATEVPVPPTPPAATEVPTPPPVPPANEAAPTQSDPNTSMGLDSKGRSIPWDERIHTGGDNRYMKGSNKWKPRRKPKDFATAEEWQSYVAKVEDELAQGFAPASPQATTQPTPSMFAGSTEEAATPPPPTEASNEISFPKLAFRIAQAKKSEKLTEEALTEYLGMFGLSSPAELATSQMDVLLAFSEMLDTAGI